MTESHDDPTERPAALAHLRETLLMPPTLEERVVASLRATATLRSIPARRQWRGAVVGGLLAASLGFFLLGRATARSVATAGSVPGTKWMLLLYEDASFQGPAPGQEQAYVEEYRRWAAAIRREGAMLDGAELSPGGAVLEAGLERARPAELEAAGAGRLTGYFVVAASSLEEAARIAASCPHLKYQGRIAIKPLGSG